MTLLLYLVVYTPVQTLTSMCGRLNIRLVRRTLMYVSLKDKSIVGKVDQQTSLRKTYDDDERVRVSHTNHN